MDKEIRNDRIAITMLWLLIAGYVFRLVFVWIINHYVEIAFTPWPEQAAERITYFSLAFRLRGFLAFNLAVALWTIYLAVSKRGWWGELLWAYVLVAVVNVSWNSMGSVFDEPTGVKHVIVNTTDSK